MSSPRFESVTPVLTVDDLPVALDFYENKLGFRIAWTWGTPPDRASVLRDGVEITLSKRGLIDIHGPSRLFIQLTEIDRYFESLRNSGVEFVVPLGDREYGLRDFHLISSKNFATHSLDRRGPSCRIVA